MNMNLEEFKKDLNEKIISMTDEELQSNFPNSISPMKKLYKIKVLHGAPKDSHTSIECYVIAYNDEQVYDYIDENYNHGYWEDVNNTSIEDLEVGEDDRETCYYLNDDYENPITFKEWCMANKGDLDDEAGWEDAHYEVTKYGWGAVCLPNYDEELILVGLNIAVDITNQ